MPVGRGCRRGGGGLRGAGSAVVAAVVLAEVGAVVAAAPLVRVRSRRSLRASAPPAGLHQAHRQHGDRPAPGGQIVEGDMSHGQAHAAAAVNIPARRFPAFL